jgi:hypothetical protein
MNQIINLNLAYSTTMNISSVWSSTVLQFKAQILQHTSLHHQSPV